MSPRPAERTTDVDARAPSAADRLGAGLGDRRIRVAPDNVSVPEDFDVDGARARLVNRVGAERPDLEILADEPKTGAAAHPGPRDADIRCGATDRRRAQADHAHL